MSETLLRVKNLHVRFEGQDAVVHAVRGVDFEVARGETLGIVGESGSGKSVTQMAVMGLLGPNAVVTAEGLDFDGHDLLTTSASAQRRLRGRRIAMIFQDPMTSLNPFLTLGTQIAEVLRLHRGLRGRALRRATIEALAEVQIPRPELRVEQYPHEFSGGMRQRAMIAMMIAGRPDLLIADEPTTALDVTVQAQILELLRELQRERSMSIILITHDLGVVAGFAERVAVMYAGRIVEASATEALFDAPAHPYTRGLRASIPRLDRDVESLRAIPGAPPDLSALLRECPFRPRCAFAVKRCAEEEPGLLDRALRPGTEHRAACWREVHEVAALEAAAAAAAPREEPLR